MGPKCFEEDLNFHCNLRRVACDPLHYRNGGDWVIHPLKPVPKAVPNRGVEPLLTASKTVVLSNTLIGHQKYLMKLKTITEQNNNLMRLFHGTSKELLSSIQKHGIKLSHDFVITIINSRWQESNPQWDKPAALQMRCITVMLHRPWKLILNCQWSRLFKVYRSDRTRTCRSRRPKRRGLPISPHSVIVKSSPGRTRTYNPTVNSFVLDQLSYRGMF